MFQKPFWLIDFNLLRCHAFAFKKKQKTYESSVHLGSPSFFAWPGRLQKKKQTNTTQNPTASADFVTLFSHIFQQFHFVSANSLSPADVGPCRATDLPRGAGCTHTSEPVHTSAKFPL